LRTEAFSGAIDRGLKLMKFRLTRRIKEEPIELDIRAEIAFHNPRYRWR
jgi:hypothetical protein